MTPTHKRRLYIVILIVSGFSLAAFLAIRAFDENILFFYSPAQVHAGEAPEDRRFRVGGLVEAGSVHREEGSLVVKFILTDTVDTIAVEYSGLLPNLFREGQGVVAHGMLRGDGVFIADEVLARHDENYMAPEVHEALKRAAEAEVPPHGEGGSR